MKGINLVGSGILVGGLLLLSSGNAELPSRPPGEALDEFPQANGALPGDYVKMTQDLVGHGMGDPRGMELRRVVFETMPGNGVRRGNKAAVGWVAKGADEVLMPNGCFYKIIEDKGAAEYSELFPTRHGPLLGFRTDSSMADHTVVLPAMLYLAGKEELYNQPESPWPGEQISAVNLVSVYIRSRLQQAQQLALEGNEAGALAITKQIAEIRPLTSAREVSDPTLRLGFEVARELGEDILARSAGSSASNSLSLEASQLLKEVREASSYPMTYPTTSYYDIPVLAKLIDRGPQVVPVMMEVYEADDSLTRIRQGNNPYQPEQGFITTRQALTLALAGIFRMSWLPTNADGELITQDILEMAARSSKNSPAGAWLYLLERDDIDPAAWDVVAKALTQTAGQRFPAGPYNIIGARPETRRNADLLSDSDRQKFGPIMARRIKEVLAKRGDVDTATTLAIALALVDGRSHYPLLSDVTDENLLRLAAGNNSRHSVNNTPRLIAARYSIGDPHALTDAEQLVKVAPLTDDVLIPIWVSRSDPAWSELRVKLFLDEQSPFSLKKGLESTSYWSSVSQSRLLDIPEFVEAYAELLENKAVIGTSTVRRMEDGSAPGGVAYRVSYNRTTGGGGSTMMAPQDIAAAEQKEATTTAEMRVADFAAIFLADLEGKPAFVATWPEAKRDAALKEIRQYLLENKDRMNALWKGAPNWPHY